MIWRERFSSSVMVSPGDHFLSAVSVIAVLGFLWIFILHLRFSRRWRVPISRNGARLRHELPKLAAEIAGHIFV